MQSSLAASALFAAPGLGAYLRLRLRLLGRLAREVGAWRLALLGPVLLAGLGNALALAAHHSAGRWAVLLLLAGALLGAHRQRADYQFVAGSAPHFRRWLAVEYTLLALPVAVALLSLGAVGPALLTPGLAALVGAAGSAPAAAPSRRRGRSPFRSEAFEWVSGVRTATAWLWWPALLGVAVWQRTSPLGPILGLLGWLLVVMSFYGTPEPFTMLATAATATRRPGRFLRRRLGLGLGYAALTASPFGGLLGLGPAGWAGALAVGAFWLLLLTMVILAKYAFYPNQTHIRTTQGLLVGLGLLGAWHPAYPPLLLTMLGGLIWQSRRRLRAVLGDGE